MTVFSIHAGKDKNMTSPFGATMHVASPEVLLAFRKSECFRVDISEVDAAAADVWAAGTCLYIMLTGEVPFFMVTGSMRLKGRESETHSKHSVAG